MVYKVKGNGEPLVLIHGLGQTYKAWAQQEELSDTYQLIMPTLRGHGPLTKTNTITLEAFAEDVLNLLDRLNIESAHIGGLSLGGVVAQCIYAKAPERVKSLILANTTSFAPSVIVGLAAVESLRAFNAMTDEEYIRDVVQSGLYRPDDYLIEQARTGFHLNREGYPDALHAISGVNYLPLLAKCEAPTLIMSSSHDNVTPYYFNQWPMQKWAKNARAVVFNNTGHLSNIQKPHQFNQAIRNFLQDIQ